MGAAGLQLARSPDQQRLVLGLATEIETGRWMVSPKAEPALRELGERGDIIKTMHRARWSGKTLLIGSSG